MAQGPQLTMLILALPQFVHNVGSARFAWFWPIWTSITIVTAVLTALPKALAGCRVVSRKVGSMRSE